MPFKPKLPDIPARGESLFRDGPAGFVGTLLQMLALWFWTTLWMFALGSTLCLILGWITGDRFLPVRMSRYLQPWVLFSLLAGLIPALLFRRFWLVAVLAVPVLVIGLAYLPLFLPRGAAPPGKGVPLKVMSFNVWSENPSLLPAAELIRDKSPDLVLLQEISGEQLRELRKGLTNPAAGADRPWNVAYAPEAMQAVVSCYPLTPLGSDGRLAKMQVVRVDTAGGPITVFNVHPRRGNWKGRYRKLQTLLQDHLLPTPGPVVLGGDFNTTERSEIYRMLSRQLRNAHGEAGRGFGFTYPANLQGWGEVLPAWPLVRIDHIFYNRYFYALGAETLRDSYGSDHLPVMASLMSVENPER